MICSTVRISSLNSIPYRYPRIPKIGMAKSTKATRIHRLNALCIRQIPDLPRPFSTLVRVVLRYRNGQIKDIVRIYVPAVVLWNKKIPIYFPKNRKRSIQEPPKNTQDRKI